MLCLAYPELTFNNSTQIIDLENQDIVIKSLLVNSWNQSIKCTVSKITKIYSKKQNDIFKILEDTLKCDNPFCESYYDFFTEWVTNFSIEFECNEQQIRKRSSGFIKPSSTEIIDETYVDEIIAPVESFKIDESIRKHPAQTYPTYSTQFFYIKFE